MVKVSIITPSFNQGRFIEKTILSILNQTYENVEYIIIDGGSTDDTVEIIEKYRNHIDIVIQEKDNGQSDAINKGFRIATGELVGWINSDDILYPECIQTIVDLYVSKPEGSIYYNCNGRMIDENDKVLKEYSKKIKNRDCLLRKNYDVLQQGSFYQRDFLKKVNYLDESIEYCMDLDLWLKLLNLAPIYYTDLPPLSAFRIWDETKTSTGRNYFLKNIREILLRHGASLLSRTVIKTYWYCLKGDLKSFLTLNKL